MTAPTITSLPAAPDRGTPGTTFSPAAATFVAALPDLVTEINAFGTWLNSNVLVSYEWGAGSAAAPSIHPSGDTDTGIYFPAANQVAIATGGAARVSVTGSGMTVNVPITGTAVQSSATDTTAGRLLTVGAFGSGSTAPPTLANLDSHDIPNGFYKVTNTNPGTHPPVSSTSVALISFKPAVNQTSQIYSLPNAGGRTYIRKSTANTGWDTWYEIYTQGSILGTVSQSGGVPTGAIIERGGNANGEYVKFADGTMECTHVMQAPYANAAALSAVWTFPASFYGRPILTPTLRLRDPDNVASTSIDVTGDMTVVSASIVSGSASFQVRGSGFTAPDFVWVSLKANGRWF